MSLGDIFYCRFNMGSGVEAYRNYASRLYWCLSCKRTGVLRHRKFESARELYRHLLEHERNGYIVPAAAFSMLCSEIALDQALDQQIEFYTQGFASMSDDGEVGQLEDAPTLQLAAHDGGK